MEGGGRQIFSSKSAGSTTTITMATADDSKLTPPVGMQIDLVAISCTSSANFAAAGTIAIQDGATAKITFVPGAVINFYQEFSTPLRITSGTNDLRIVVTGATSGTITVRAWYQYTM